MKREGFFEAIATLVGTIIGAGVLGIPYVVSKAGLISGSILIIVIGILLVFLYLYLGEVVLRTEGNHQLTGYAEKYLGRWGKRAMAFSMIFGIYGALIAYIIGVGESLHALLGLTPLTFSLLFFVVASFVVYIGLRTIKKVELVMSFIFLAVILFITFYSSLKINIQNLLFVNPKLFFLPYGVIFFAFLGTSSIPIVKEVLTKERKKIKKAIIIGAVIPIIVYFLFTFAVVGALGKNTTEIATIGLGQLLGETMVIFGNLYAIFAMGSSFLILGLALREMYGYDYKLKKKLSWFLTCIPPLALFLIGAKSFIQVIGITGAIAGGVDGILIVLMYEKARKMKTRKPEYKVIYHPILLWFLIALFSFGVIYTILGLI